MTDNGVNEKILELKSQVAALEQLWLIDEQAVLDQADQLEQALGSLRQASDQVAAQVGSAELAQVQAKMAERRPAGLLPTEERHLFSTLIDNLPDFVYVKDAESRFVINNLAHRRVLKAQSQADLMGKTDFDIFPPELAQQYYADEQSVISSGQAVIDREEPYLDETGQQRWLSTTKMPLRDERGQMVGLVGISRDITDRKQMAEVLQESQALYQSSLDALPQNVYRIDRAGRITFGNKAYLSNLGMTLAECLGKTAYDFFPKELADKYTADDQRVMETGQIFETVEAHQSPTSDDTLYVRVVKAPVRDLTGAITGLQAIFWDVTAERQAEMALSRRAAELETAAQVSTVTATILDTEKLLYEVADLTRERFGLYHVHIYLLNEAGDSLDLAAGAGEVGRYMVAEGWRIPLAQKQSLVARAARTRQGVIVNDVRAEPGFLPNRLLPETSSEMAVPLLVGGRVLGVLDVQADEVGHFTEEDVRIQSILAAQIAVALQNARQYEETRAALAEVQQSQALLRAVIDATPDWILVTDREHRFRLVNQAYADSLRMAPADIIGKQDTEVGIPEEFVKGDPDKGIRGFWVDDIEVMENGQTKIIEAEPTVIAGEPAFLSTIKAPMRDASGEVWGVLAYIRNITSLKHTEETLAKRAEELSCLNDLGREMEGSPSIPTLLHWTTERIPPAMQYPELCLVAIEYGDQTYGMSQAIHLPSQMTHGLYVGSEIVGRIYIAYTEENDFLNEESALLGGIATRLGGHIENRRLLEQLQLRARREQILREVSDRIRGSVDVETIMRTAAQEVGQVLGRPAFVYLGNGSHPELPSTAQPEEMEA